MLVFPNCKINLGLRIINKRADGYHNLETIFFPLPFHDALELVHSTTPPDQPGNVFTCSGISIGDAASENLCVKAWNLLHADFLHLPPLQIHLHKQIPVGAGLGGGSADAAFTLMAANEKFALNLPEEKLLAYALQLGSDCPFFIINKPCLASGRGEILSPIDLSLSGYFLVMVNPGIHIHTGWAFSMLDRSKHPALADSLEKIVSLPMESWRGQMINDFEKPVFEKFPEIASISATLYEKGARFALMSGSGSTVFGIFANDPGMSWDFPATHLVRCMLL
jgi:4-diphosphocytidyl-2-C-methyl-D-erythritol kinase